MKIEKFKKMKRKEISEKIEEYIEENKDYILDRAEGILWAELLEFSCWLKKQEGEDET